MKWAAADLANGETETSAAEGSWGYYAGQENHYQGAAAAAGEAFGAVLGGAWLGNHPEEVEAAAGADPHHLQDLHHSLGFHPWHSAAASGAVPFVAKRLPPAGT